jgi:hypothetical protein
LARHGEEDIVGLNDFGDYPDVLRMFDAAIASLEPPIDGLPVPELPDVELICV